jgi:hypothetical protein
VRVEVVVGNDCKGECAAHGAENEGEAGSAGVDELADVANVASSSPVPVPFFIAKSAVPKYIPRMRFCAFRNKNLSQVETKAHRSARSGSCWAARTAWSRAPTRARRCTSAAAGPFPSSLGTRAGDHSHLRCERHAH